MVELGREDDEWRRRSRTLAHLKFYNTEGYGLIHYNHKSRTKDMRKQNSLMEKKAGKEGKVNWLT